MAAVPGPGLHLVRLAASRGASEGRTALMRRVLWVTVAVAFLGIVGCHHHCCSDGAGVYAAPSVPAAPESRPEPIKKLPQPHEGKGAAALE